MTKMKKKVFIISTIVFVLIFAALALFVLPNKKYTFPLYEEKTNILIVGDSMFCNNIFGSENLAEYLTKKTDCEMQNCSIGGTCASKINKNNELDYYSDKLNFYNISDIICTGNLASASDNVKSLSVAFPDAYYKLKFLAGTDPAKEDILIINYGINDCFMRVKCTSDNPYDEYTYGGAMRQGIKRISEKYPDLTIIIPEITYTTLIQNGERDEAFDEITAEYREEYNEELKKIASEYNNVYFFPSSDYIEINDENYEEYLFDGIHFNVNGKEAYSSALAEYIGEIK